MASVTDLSHFPALKTLDTNLLKTVRLLSIFGVGGEEVIFVTNEDKVYAFGRNRFGGLALGHQKENRKQPELIHGLRDQKVIDIFCGYEHWVALTASGQCFSWGHNQFGQMGVADVKESLAPKLIQSLEGEAIVDVGCGAHHTLALTRDGHLYTFGSNKSGQLGDNTHGWRSQPKKLPIGEEVVAMSCGKNHSLVLTASKRVFGWGINQYGQLGRPFKPSDFVVFTPKPIPTLESITFSKAICGSNYSLLLTTDGSIYGFGENTCGQIGNGGTVNQFSPFKLVTDVKFKDIIVYKENDISFALSSDDKYYVWGLVSNRRQLLPKEVTQTSNSVHDMYAMYAKTKLTFKTFATNNRPKPEYKVQKKDSLNICLKDQKTNGLKSVESPDIGDNSSPKLRKLDQCIDLVNFPSLYWTLFSQETISKIRLVRVFGRSANKVIFATNCDKVYCYGFNRDLCLGLGTSEERVRRPVLNKYLSFKKLIDIVNGYEHCLGLTADGLCYSWGNNRYGQLGVGNTQDTSVPQLIDSLSDVFVTRIACGSYHSMALTNDGDLFSWGHNTFAQLGDRTYSSREVPVQVMISEPVVSISCGNNHSLALTKDGDVYVWGVNETGQLGRDPDCDVQPNRLKPMSNRPRKLIGFQNIKFKKAVCGENHVLLLTFNGFVYAFGQNTNGQIGNGSTRDQFTPIRLNDEKKMKIADIDTHFVNTLSLAVSTSNKCYVWGFVDNENVLRPKVVPESADKLLDVYSKYSPNKTTFKTLIVNTFEVLNSFGICNEENENFDSEFNFVDIMDSVHQDNQNVKSFEETIDMKLFPILNSTPTLWRNSVKNCIRLLTVFGANESKVIYITNDDVYAFGDNRDGCLGLETDDIHIAKPRLNRLLSGHNILDIACGAEHCIALSSSGGQTRCWAWGQNKHGQLGIGKDWASKVPKPIQGLDNKTIVQICCGAYHSMALTMDGQVFAWGHNELGQLGDRSYQSRLVPTHIPIKHPIARIVCGQNHSLALINFGLIYIWGLNAFGQLGRRPEFDYKPRRQQSVSYYPCPSNIFKNVQFVDAAAGPNHTMLLSRDGNVYAFGNNDNGQVGNGQVGQQHQPIRVNNDVVFKKIFSHFTNDLSIGVSIENKVYVWGLVANKKVLSPQLISDSNEASVFNVYAKYAKTPITFKSVVLTEQANDSMTTFKTHFDSFRESDRSNDGLSSGDNRSLISDISSRNTSTTDTSSAAVFGDSMRNAFNDSKSSDFAFVCGEKRIYCHKTILLLRNNKFWQKISNQLIDDKEVAISADSYDSFNAFLQYMYGLEPEIDQRFARDLRTMAKIFNEPDLDKLCAQHISDPIESPDLNNVCQLYEKAVTEGSSDLEKTCVEFAAKNWKNVCKSDAFQTLDDKLSKRLMLSVLKS